MVNLQIVQWIFRFLQIATLSVSVYLLWVKGYFWGLSIWKRLILSFRNFVILRKILYRVQNRFRLLIFFLFMNKCFPKVCRIFPFIVRENSLFINIKILHINFFNTVLFNIFLVIFLRLIIFQFANFLQYEFAALLINVN